MDNLTNGKEITLDSLIEEKDDNEGEIKEKYLKIVQNLFVYIYPFQGIKNIDNEGHEYFSLQVLEVMVSVRLQCYWNSFKTH